MTHNKKHIKDSDLPEEFNNFINNVDVQWKKSKSEVWDELASKLENKPLQKTKVISNFNRYLIAASISLLVIAGTVSRYYSKTIISPVGKSTAYLLPDGSEVKLNAESKINFHPIWWYVTRELNLEGEAFFKVKKGEKFTVNSEKGQTSVLGTSFNIYARGQEYEVTCVTGTVKVESKISDAQRTITKNEMAILKASGNLTIKTDIDTRLNTSWMVNEHFFNGRLDKVIEEIERQYGVNIKMTSGIVDLNVNLTSPKEVSVEPILDRICPVNGLVYIKTSKTEYTIKKK